MDNAVKLIHDLQKPALQELLNAISCLTAGSQLPAAASGLFQAVNERDEDHLHRLVDLFTGRIWNYEADAYHTAVDTWCDSAADDDTMPGVLADADIQTLADDSDLDEERDPGQG